ncbi:MAG: hypothetical protein GF334_02875 [Candidatus Altiarchaeales archaeon]|nr:hypothetical protein [Candidatus Altiarchaeales archaeon]
MDVELKHLSSLLLENSEELRDSLEEFKKGSISDEEFTTLVEEIVQTRVSSLDTAKVKEIQESGFHSLQRMREQEDFDPKNLLMGNEKTGPKSLHPLYSALLAERLQFDGDAPELRTGPLPPGARPAPSVGTSARSPVAIGAQLEKASEKVLGLISEGVRAALGEDPDEGQLAVLPASVDPPEYRRGSVPVPIEAEDVTGSSLAAVDGDLSKSFAWKAISTTQGRKSVVDVIRSLVMNSLDPGKFFPVDSEGQEVRESFPWTFQMSHEGALQSNFCFVDTCAGYFIRCMKDFEGPVNFSIETVDKISDRQVGWRLDIFE